MKTELMEEYQHVDIQIRELTNRKKEISEKSRGYFK